nr:G-type lectin S-receptor-like serine/threonine-protein kinase LECRK2 [Ipomoea trifida]
MANLLFTFLFIPIIFGVTGVAAELQPATNITSGSILHPDRHPTSWLSPSGLFAFGFYQQGGGFQVGIWLQGTPQRIVVWTADRDAPPVPSDSYLQFGTGKLILWTKGSRRVIVDPPETATPTASMLDSGNFVIYNKTGVVWQSFDLPTDTILVGQHLVLNNRLVSSVSTSDTSSGRFYLGMQGDGNLVAYPLNSLSRPEDSYWANPIQTRGEFGDVNGAFVSVDPSGQLFMNVSNDIQFEVKSIANSSNEDTSNRTVIYRATLDPDGILRLYSHRFGGTDNSTVIEWSAKHNQCQVTGFCGVNSYCTAIKGGEGDCLCFPGFQYFNPKMKYQGCYRGFIYEELCRKEDPNLSYNVTVIKNLTLGGYPFSYLSMDERDCQKSCQEDCACWAAQYVDGTCSKFKLPLIYSTLNENNKPDMAIIKQLYNTSQLPGQGITISGETGDKDGTRKRIILILSVVLGFLAFLFSLIAIFSFVFYRNRAIQYQKLSEKANLGLNEEFTLRSFSYSELDRATDGFKEELTHSNFGKVYKGKISEGDKTVAVKRLEKVVEEGEREFRAEMRAIGRTRHKNLVRLIGYCAEGSKRLLVYEYMSNGCLANLLFKAKQRPDWTERVKLARDIARGICYLHEECETCIIHCNIRPQNILVDDSWTAKISEFGLAKLLTQSETGNPTVVNWTNGYLAPELQTNALITEKVDVYSYGIMLLEIICCRSYLEVNVTTADEMLLSTWVSKCFVEDNLQQLVGEEEIDMKSLERMVKVGLLCIQDNPALRPSMKGVVLMLDGTMDIPLCLPASTP